jgi:hypothetical protein
MQLVDFAKLNRQCLNITMADMGVADFEDLPLTVLLERLNLGSDRNTKEHFPVQQLVNKVDLSGSLQALKQQRKIVDTIGPIKISYTTICFSTLLGIKPKEYLKQYVEVAKILCTSSDKLKFVVWLEDALTVLKNDWDISTIQQAVNTYRAFFYDEFPECQILLSSEIAPVGIPQSFADKLSAITTEDFLSVLPFHRRNPMFVKTIDMIHFVWQCYVLYRLPGVHLACITQKRHFQLFRKVSGQQITAILLPIGSENIIAS